MEIKKHVQNFEQMPSLSFALTCCVFGKAQGADSDLLEVLPETWLSMEMFCFLAPLGATSQPGTGVWCLGLLFWFLFFSF